MTTIEPTDEMINDAWHAFLDKAGPDARCDQAALRAAVAEVLAIVERDYEPRRCDDRTGDRYHRCTKPKRHGGYHGDRFSGAEWTSEPS